MSKTLDQYPREQWPDMVGRWCELAGGGIAVLTEVRSTGAMLFTQGDPKPLFTSAERITPRFDLPGAWNADGTPPA